MSNFVTKLLPTTKNVNERMSIVEALEILSENNVEFEIIGKEIVEGMYFSDDLQEIVEEQLVPIRTNVESRHLATIFDQECILEFDNSTAKLVASNGDIWAEFDNKVEYSTETIENAVELQRKMALHFGGSSRIDNFVWAWATEEQISTWVTDYITA